MLPARSGAEPGKVAAPTTERRDVRGRGQGVRLAQEARNPGAVVEFDLAGGQRRGHQATSRPKPATGSDHTSTSIAWPVRWAARSSPGFGGAVSSA